MLARVYDSLALAVTCERAGASRDLLSFAHASPSRGFPLADLPLADPVQDKKLRGGWSKRPCLGGEVADGHADDGHQREDRQAHQGQLPAPPEGDDEAGDKGQEVVQKVADLRWDKGKAFSRPVGSYRPSGDKSPTLSEIAVWIWRVSSLMPWSRLPLLASTSKKATSCRRTESRYIIRM